MIIVPTNSLTNKADRSPFKEYISKSTNDNTIFWNISGDTLLYIPTGTSRCGVISFQTSNQIDIFI